MPEGGEGFTPSQPKIQSQDLAPSLAPKPESSEMEPHKLDLTVVFGQGPIKPVLLFEELTPDQQKEWNEFSQNPLKSKEPEFRVIPKADNVNIERIRAKIESSQKDPSLSPEEKEQLKKAYELQINTYRDKLQHNPRLALHRYGRLVSLAAGAALVEGHTKDLILSGGKTVPGWAQPNGVNPLSQELRTNWPSEAELMKQQIIQIFGKRYQEKFGKDIAEVLHIEESSPTTIHNFAFALERYKNIFESANSIGFLSTDVHLPRVMALAQLTVDKDASMNPVDAQKTLEERAVSRRKILYENIVKYTHDIEENPIAAERTKKEETLLKELTDPKVITFWEMSGKYPPELHETILRVLGKGVGTGWEGQAREILTKYGIDYAQLTPELLLKKVIKGELSHDNYASLKKEIFDLAAAFPTQYPKTGTAEPVSKKDV